MTSSSIIFLPWKCILSLNKYGGLCRKIKEEESMSHRGKVSAENYMWQWGRTCSRSNTAVFIRYSGVHWGSHLFLQEKGAFCPLGAIRACSYCCSSSEVVPFLLVSLWVALQDQTSGVELRVWLEPRRGCNGIGILSFCCTNLLASIKITH